MRIELNPREKSNVGDCVTVTAFAGNAKHAI
jgi:hypothetical protein